MDGVLADFESAVEAHPERDNPIYKEHPDKIPHIFRDLPAITGAIAAVNQLLESPLYEVYILSTAPWNNPSAWSDKRLWIEEHFGEIISRRLILTHRKDLVKGDILIDDRSNNGAKDFEGQWIRFGTDPFRNWDDILLYLL